MGLLLVGVLTIRASARCRGELQDELTGSLPRVHSERFFATQRVQIPHDPVFWGLGAQRPNYVYDGFRALTR